MILVCSEMMLLVATCSELWCHFPAPRVKWFQFQFLASFRAIRGFWQPWRPLCHCIIVQSTQTQPGNYALRGFVHPIPMGASTLCALAIIVSTIGWPSRRRTIKRTCATAGVVPGTIRTFGICWPSLTTTFMQLYLFFIRTWVESRSLIYWTVIGVRLAQRSDTTVYRGSIMHPGLGR